jgi:GAF domain-containing protein
MSSDREAAVIEAFVHLADTLVEEYDVIDFLAFLTDRCVDLVDIDEAAVMIAGPAGRVHPVAASSERSHLLELFELQNSDGPCLDSFHTGQTVTSADLTRPDAMQRWPTFAPEAVAVGFRAVHSVPMRLRSNVIGALNLLRVEPGEPAERDLRLIRALADVATIGLLQHRAIDQANDASASLQLALTSRVRIEQAKGIIAERANLTIDEAFEVLRRYARDHQSPVAGIAARVIQGELDIRPGLRAE